MKNDFKKGETSPGLVEFIEKIKKYNHEFFTKVLVDTKTKKVTLFSGKFYSSIDCEIGRNGSVLLKDSKEGDGKTPICSTRVRHIDMPTLRINNHKSAVFTKTLDLKINLGPCFICLYIPNIKTDKIRGIGFHGYCDDRDGLVPTDGCIRLSNADLLLIRKFFFKNLKIFIV
ncbi:MAG: L,D-transpeptidase [Candidatus Nomurabacteria bacterium]|nr:L,D-transpeptidase [Candidatus Nomurabacteria bacterium]